jgi:hypothetical protein
MGDVSQVIQQLVPVVQQINAGILKAGTKGPIGGMRNIGALASTLKEGAQQYQENSLIEGLIDALNASSQHHTDEHAQGTPWADIDPQAVASSVNLDGLLGEFGEQGMQLKQFILHIVENVAGASGDGLFGRGEKINAEEQSFITTLRQSLGL